MINEPARRRAGSDLWLGLLGNLQVRRGPSNVPLSRGTLRVMLATLALEANRTVPFERIIDRLWGEDPPASARSTTQVYAMRLRRALGDDASALIRTRPTGYLLEIAPDQVDVATFHHMVERSRHARTGNDRARESELLTGALALWRGPALLDVPSEPLQAAVVPRLVEERLQALQRRLEIDLELGSHAEVVGELTELTQEHPTREPFWTLLIRALAHSGRQGEALDAYRRLRVLLRDQLGIEPGEEVQRLHREILAGGHCRAAPAAPASEPPADEVLPRIVPSQLPPDVPSFVGRSTQLAQLTAELAPDRDAPAPILIVSGPPGVGKTALTVQMAHRVRAHYPDGQLYANLHGYSPTSPLAPEVVLARFLRGLGVPASQIPTEQDEQVNLYRSLLADRRILVVLDNAAEPAQVRPLLPGQPGCAALVTSRDDLRGLVALEGAKRVGVAALDRTDSEAVLAAVIGSSRVAEEPEAVAALLEQCGGLPLALRVAGANLQASPHLSIADYLDALRRRGVLAQLRVPGDAHAGVQAAFDLSYTRLAPPVAHLFRLLGTVPGPDFTAPAAAALAGCTLARAEQYLDALVAANLVVPSAAGRYELHDLIREYAAANSGEDTDAGTAASRLQDFYLHTARTATDLLYPDLARLPLPPALPGGDGLPLANETVALEWLDSERANLVAAVRSAVDSRNSHYAWQLADALRGYFWARGHAVEGLTVCDAALAAARKEQDRCAEANVLDLMGLINFALSRYDLARTLHAQALGIYRSSGDRAGQAICLYHLGRVSKQVGPMEESVRYHREALALARRTGDVNAQTLNTNYIGVGYLSAGRADLALRYHLQAMELCRPGNQSVRVRLTGALANVAWHRGDLTIAIGLYQECLRMARQLGNRSLEANSLVCLAEARCDAGAYGEAIRDAGEGARLGHAVGELRSAIGGTEVVTTAGFRSGQLAGAVEEYHRILDRARKIHYRYGETSIGIALAVAYRAGGDPARAVTHAEESLRLMRDSGVRDLEARALVELGHGYLDRGDGERAGRHLDRALTLARRGGLRLTEARGRYVLGLAQHAASGREAAVPHWRAALESFTRIGAPESATVRALLAENTAGTGR